jgi:serine/threonine protein kinase
MKNALDALRRHAHQRLSVQEFCNGGSLRDALTKGLFRTQHMPQRWLPLMHVLTNIANGMVYIHGRRICHGDLNPSNLLFKVCSFPPSCLPVLNDVVS